MSDQESPDETQGGAVGEEAPDRPTEDAEDLASSVQEEESTQQTEQA